MLRFLLLAGVIAALVSVPLVQADDRGEIKTPDPAATKLLADARAARALWTNFPGFRAEIAVNLDGKVSKGQVMVEADGKVQLQGLDKDATTWAKRVLTSLVDHRLSDSISRNTPCVFADNVADHPQGRLIRLLNDELHSSYRIRDQLITEVNRQMKDHRFTISMQDSSKTAEGKYLSGSFVVNHWDLKTGDLVRSEANYQGWARVGKFDLPTSAVVIASSKKTAESDGKAAKSLTLTKHQLLESAAK